MAERAAVLRRAADDVQAQLPKFCALLVKEAFKTWGDAVSEVREAIDFLRYYADEAERIMAPVHLPGPTGETNELRLRGRGVWVCISPWNFRWRYLLGRLQRRLRLGTQWSPSQLSKRLVWPLKLSGCCMQQAYPSVPCSWLMDLETR